MQTLLSLLPVIGCLAMGAVMWMMMRQHAPTQHQQTTVDPVTAEEINRLRAEINLLKQDQPQHDQAAADKTVGGTGTGS